MYSGFFLIAIIFSLAFTCFGGLKINSKSDTIAESRLNALKSDIGKVLRNHEDLCAGIALVNEDGAAWITGLGKSNVKFDRMATVNTMFRIASISKMFVAFSILKLQEEGKLNLEDKIKDIIPDVKFENPWEETDPIRIVHLLEHTSGWDEIHLVEMMHNEAHPIPLKQALEFHPHSRTSRWIPGSRMAYCNSGYAVAAYIVQKVSGRPYEEYIREAIWKPLKMNHTTFFNDDLFKKWGAVTYNWAMKEVDYKHELYRPSGSINSSAGDLANVLRMLLNRGSLDTLKLFNRESIERMEISKSTPGAKSGLELGYGLGNFTSNYKGFIYHGHEGAMDGGLSQLAYLPEYGVGYVVLLNANNAHAMLEISSLIRDFEIETLPAPHNKTNYSNEISIDEGYYVAINPRSQDRFYQDLIINIERVEVFDDHLTMSWIVPSAKKTYHPVSATQFTYGKTKKIGLVEANDPIAGKVLYTDDLVLKPISRIRVFGQISILVSWLILMLIGGLITFVLVFFYFRNRKKYADALKVSLIPTIASLFLILMVLLPRVGIDNADILFSKPSILSIGLMICSILFTLSSVWSVIAIYKSRKRKINKITY